MQNKLSNILCIIFSLLMIGCTENPNPCGLPENILKDLHTLDSLVKVPEIRKWNSEWMKNNYNEPSIIEANTETYRFIWDSSFAGVEIYRIENLNGRFKVVKKTFSSHHDTIGIVREFEISKETWNNIVKSLERNNFWTYPVSDNKIVLDGTSWFLEGFKPEKDKCTLSNYHYVSRSSIDTTFISMCKLFFQLNGNS